MARKGDRNPLTRSPMLKIYLHSIPQHSWLQNFSSLVSVAPHKVWKCRQK